MKPYVPSGQSDPGGIARMAGACLAAGAVAGTLLHYVERWLNLLLLFPALLGAVAGGVGAAVIAQKRIRAPLAAGLIALAAGALAYAMDSFLSCWEVGAADLGFLDFLRLRAEMGTRIGRVGSSGSPLELGGTATWILWALELACAAGIAFAVAWGRAREPFCEPCGRWYGEREAALIVGALTEETAVRAALEIQDAVGLARLATTGTPTLGAGRAALAVRVRRCSGCAHAEAWVQLVRLKRDRRGRLDEKVVTRGLVPLPFWQAVADALTGGRSGTVGT
jgi:hypothetical protein